MQAGDEVLNRARAGDREAFDALIGPLIEPAFRLAFGMLHDRSAAEDVVQEAAFRAWRKLQNLRPGTEMRPWFLAIVANCSRTLARRSWWSVLRIPAPDRGAGEVEDAVVRGAEVRASLRRLNPDQRAAIVLRYYLDLPLEEVAAVTGVPVGTVKSRINRGLAAMRLDFVPEAVS
ncbi:MAG TPA: RNA polymerase sigma factor [Candidatus Dormibacteraeota bacterium]